MGSTRLRHGLRFTAKVGVCLVAVVWAVAGVSAAVGGRWGLATLFAVLTAFQVGWVYAIWHASDDQGSVT